MYECDMIHNDFNILKGFEPEICQQVAVKVGRRALQMCW